MVLTRKTSPDGMRIFGHAFSMRGESRCPRNGSRTSRSPLPSGQAENGTLVCKICRKMGVAEATFYRWKKVYVGTGVSEIRRLKQLEEENAKLNVWSPTSAWTRRCCRMPWKKMVKPGLPPEKWPSLK